MLSSGKVAAYRPAAVLRVSGEDALPFLQGQFTQELRPAVAPAVAYGLWLNQKGRILADSHVLRVSPQELWLTSLECPAAALRERLEAYVIADDVEIEDRTAEWLGFLLIGDAGRACMAGSAGGMPAPGAFVRVADGFGFIGRRGLDDPLELLVPGPPPPSLAAFEQMGLDEVERARILARLPAVPRDAGPGDLPSEAGLDEVAISYTKGCYLGQEVIARLKAMGRVRRRLQQVRGVKGPVPTAPAPLHQGEKVVGELRSAVDDGAGGWVGLAMMALLALDPASPLSFARGGEAVLVPKPGEARP